MNIHEYQAKNLFKEYGIPTEPFIIAGTPAEVGKAALEIQGPPGSKGPGPHRRPG